MLQSEQEDSWNQQEESWLAVSSRFAMCSQRANSYRSIRADRANSYRASSYRANRADRANSYRSIRADRANSYRANSYRSIRADRANSYRANRANRANSYTQQDQEFLFLNLCTASCSVDPLCCVQRQLLVYLAASEEIYSPTEQLE